MYILIDISGYRHTSLALFTCAMFLFSLRQSFGRLPTVLAHQYCTCFNFLSAAVGIYMYMYCMCRHPFIKENDCSVRARSSSFCESACEGNSAENTFHKQTECLRLVVVVVVCVAAFGR